jgi:hypothetical protein
MNFRYTIGMALKNAIIGDIFIGQVPGSEKSVFRLKKDNFQWPNVSRSKAGFDPRPPPMENILLALYTHFRGVTDQRMAHKSPLK